MMAVVSILLSLVLISTSIVSGVFARFVITQTGQSSFVITKFGAGLSVDVSALTGIAGVTKTSVTNGKSISVTVSNLKIGPGDVIPNAVRFNIYYNSSKPKFTSFIKITTTIQYTESNFSITNDDKTSIGGTAKNTTTYFMPIGFTFGYQSNTSSGFYHYVSEPWIVSTDSNDIAPATIQNAITAGIKSKVTSPTPTVEDATKNVVKIGNFTKDKQPKLTISKPTTGTVSYSNFDLGFVWPFEYEDAEGVYDFDEIATYLAGKSDTSISVTFTVTFEQA